MDERLRRVAYADFLTAPNLESGWLLETNRQFVGYLVLAFAFSFEFGGRNAFIDELYVVPEYRRRGIGWQALQFAVRTARQGGVSALHLEVSPKNLAALELYRRAEFLDHDRYLMTRWLTGRSEPMRDRRDAAQPPGKLLGFDNESSVAVLHDREFCSGPV